MYKHIVCVCVFIKLHIIAVQSGRHPIIVIFYATRIGNDPKGGSMLMRVCVCIF